MPLGHERWFTRDELYPVQLEAVLTPQVWIPVAIAAGTTLLALALARGRRSLIPGPVDLGMKWENYERLLSWMPLIIGLHAAVPLLVSAVNRRLFVPNLELPWSFLGGVLGLAEIVIALGFIYGALTRIAAGTLAAVWFAGVLLFGPLALLEQALYLGIAFFLFATGRGPLAFDMALQWLHRPIERLLPYAVPALRVLTGLSVIVVAFDEKLANVPMGLALLARYPFNFFPDIGFEGITDRDFILIAGTVELTFGALLVSGAFIRAVILVLWLPFNLTLPFLGWRELVGHLPIYGIMALLLIWGEERPQTEAALAVGIEDREE